MAFKQDDLEQKKLDKFLDKVNDLEEIVKGFQSTDLNKQNEAMTRADAMLKEQSVTGFNKTAINRKENEESVLDTGMQFTGPSTNQQAFLDALEADANQRARARKERHERASKVKEKANAAFRDGEYHAALKLYTEAIGISKDMTFLYTNRGMTYMKLERYQDAIDDCDMAVRIDSAWMKAYVIKANALKCIKKFEESIKTYKKILEHHPTKTKLIEGYVAEAEEEYKVDELEKQAKKRIEENITSEPVAKTIALLGVRVKPETEPKELTFSYFAAALKRLADYLSDDVSKTMFRIEGGFKILASKAPMRDVLLKNSFDYAEQSDFAQCFLILVQAACSKCPKNTVTFLEEELMPEITFNLLQSKDRQVKRAAIVCMYEFASNNKMIELVTGLFSAQKILSELLSDDVLQLKLLEEAVHTINRYAESERFRKESESHFDIFVLPVYHKFFDEICHNQRKELAICVQSIIIFMKNEKIHHTTASNKEFLSSCVACIERIVHVMEPSTYRDELLSNLHDLVKYLILYKCVATTEIAPRLATCIMPVLNWNNDILVTKTLVTLTKCFGCSKESTKCFQSPAGLVFVKKIYKFIKSDHPTIRAFALKVLCFLGQNGSSVLRNLPKFDKAYNILRKVLNTDETDADVANQGHAALLMGYLAELPGGMDPIFDYKGEDTNVVKHFLDLARYSKSKETRYNVMVSLGKMATNDQRILAELRRFDGINILAKLKPPNV